LIDDATKEIRLFMKNNDAIIDVGIFEKNEEEVLVVF